MRHYSVGQISAENVHEQDYRSYQLNMRKYVHFLILFQQLMTITASLRSFKVIK